MQGWACGEAERDGLARRLDKVSSTSLLRGQLDGASESGKVPGGGRRKGMRGRSLECTGKEKPGEIMPRCCRDDDHVERSTEGQEKRPSHGCGSAISTRTSGRRGCSRGAGGDASVTTPCEPHAESAQSGQRWKQATRIKFHQDDFLDLRPSRSVRGGGRQGRGLGGGTPVSTAQRRAACSPLFRSGRRP